jgi:hypothetical protein
MTWPFYGAVMGLTTSAFIVSGDARFRGHDEE